MKNRLFSILFGVALVVLILTFSIALPIYLRFFYYLQIDGLSLPYYSGYTFEEIKTAYDQMLNYLTLPSGTFASGIIPHTATFANHMADVKALFGLNLFALIISTSIVISFLILNKKGFVKLSRPFGMSIAFTSCLSLLSIVFIIGGLCALDFNGTFNVFHHIFFAGKDDWLINPAIDPVINILPIDFFLNCALLILSSIVIICFVVIIFQVAKKKKANR